MRIAVRPVFYLDVSREEFWLLENAGAGIANRWHESLWSTIQLLETQPLVGRLRSDLAQAGIRSWRVRDFHRWIVFYEVHGDTLVLHRVVSGTMNLEALKFD